MKKNIEYQTWVNTLLKRYRVLSRELSGCPFVHTIDEAVALMESWLTERDHLKFFQTIIDARDEACRLFDRCKNINLFHNDQFPNYEKVRKFIDDNRDNFAFLTDEQQQKTVETIRAILTDEEPWDKMPSYMKMMRTLNGQLGECKTQLVDKIKANYNKVFDELEQYANEVNVPRDKFAKRDITISLKTSTSNFYALQANADTCDFMEEEMKNINNAIPAPPPSTPGGNGGSTPSPAGPQPKPRMRKIVHLNTHTTKPMRSEADVDIYLAGLKAELMQYIDDNNDIIIG